MVAAPNVIYAFGPFRVDPEHQTVLRDDQPVAITAKVFAVLLTLVRRCDEVVTKDELLQAVWPGRVVEEANLSQSIFVLRKLLGDTHDRHRYIVTLSGKGYRFAGPVHTLAQAGATADTTAAPSPPPATMDRRVATGSASPQSTPDADGVPATPPASVADVHRGARRLSVLTIAVLALVVAVLAAGYFIRHHAIATTTGSGTQAFDPPKGSLVVLPFENISGDPRQQYLSDGITEELTDALGDNPGLRVTAWETASTLRGSHKTAPAIGKQLDVSDVLTGSIAHQGNQMRVTAELVDTRTGVQLWSQHYDGSFADIFKVQDEVSEAIAGALNVKFATTDLPRAGTANPEAHDLVLRGRALEDKRDAASLETARGAFEGAIVLDPDYAEAHAMLSRTLLMLTQRSDLPLDKTLPRVRTEAEAAVALDPRSADAWVALGNAESSAAPPQNAEALRAYRRALELDPSNADAHVDYGDLLPAKSGLEQYLQAVQLDPGNANAWNNVASSYQDGHQWAREIAAIKTVIRLNPEEVDSAFDLAYVHQQLRQYDAMVKAFDLVKPANAVDRQQVEAGRLVYGSLRNPEGTPQALAAVQALARHQANLGVAGNLLYMYMALGKTEPAFQLLSNVCPADPDDCGDLMVNPLFTPLRADPRFQALARKYTTAPMQRRH